MKKRTKNYKKYSWKWKRAKISNYFCFKGKKFRFFSGFSRNRGVFIKS